MKAFPFQWTGYWRIYRTDGNMKDEDVLGGPTLTEQEAWDQARTNHGIIKERDFSWSS
jgi:hypothetical protein